MRYDKFILTKDDSFEGEPTVDLMIIPTGVSDEESILYGKQVSYIEGVYFTIMELFDLDNIRYNLSSKYIFFSIPELPDSDCSKEISSPKLDREKMLYATSFDVSGAIIDLILDRDNWSNQIWTERVNF